MKVNKLVLTTAKISKCFAAVALLFFLSPFPALALSDCSGFIPSTESNEPTQLKGAFCLAANGIEYAIYIGGGLAVIALAISGIKIFTARADPKALQAARDSLTWSIAGLVIVLLAVTVVRIFTNIILGTDQVGPSIDIEF